MVIFIHLYWCSHWTKISGTLVQCINWIHSSFTENVLWCDRYMWKDVIGKVWSWTIKDLQNKTALKSTQISKHCQSGLLLKILYDTKQRALKISCNLLRMLIYSKKKQSNPFSSAQNPSVGNQRLSKVRLHQGHYLTCVPDIRWSFSLHLPFREACTDCQIPSVHNVRLHIILKGTCHIVRAARTTGNMK